MTYSPLYGSMLGLLQLAVPGYALRLARAFGAQRVGWPIFIAFLSLALLHVVTSTQPSSAAYQNWVLLLYGAIPVLLLIGLGHVEAVSRERLRAEREEATLRGEMQRQFQARTAELERTTEELQQELARCRQSEEASKAAEAHSQFLFQENPQPMWLFDLRNMQVLGVNKAALRHYGYSREEFMSLGPRDLHVGEESAAFARDAFRPCTGAQERGIWRHRRKNGSIVEVQVTAVDLMYAGYPARLMVVQDVTELRQAQKRGLELQKLEVMADLAGRVAEHFQKPLTVLEGYTNLLLRKELEPTAAEEVQRIAATVEQARAAARQLMAVAGRRTLKTQALDFNRFVDQELRTLSRAAEGLLRVEKVFGPDLPPVTTDPAVLREILAGLVANAREASGQGSTLSLRTEVVHVDESYVRFRPEAKLGTYACLTLCDTGCGMDPEHRAHLFEPFFTTKAPAQSAGLGLAAAYGVLKQQGGWLEVASDVGIGTTVRVFLPCSLS
jgi:two-component system, cell cycle sensor histidine kinase and response regulator CckA